MPSEPSDHVPGVDDQQLAAVAGLLPDLPNIRAEPADRFVQAVRSLVEKRAQKQWPNEDDSDLSVFVMVDHPRQVGERHGATPFADPIAKDEAILGRLFFANRDASGGRVMLLPTDPNAILEWLDENGLGSCPIVTAYRKSKQLVTRRAGTSNPARSDPIRDRVPSATLPELLKALEHYHRTRLLTPICCPDGVWEPCRSHEYVPGPKPEKSIQSDLELALNFWFHGVVKAEHEDSTNIGRIDVRLLKKSKEEESLSYWVILELKVIKSFANASRGKKPSQISPSTNVNAIVDGLQQAASYRENRSAEKGLLEVYDLRKDKSHDLTTQPSVSSVKNGFAVPPEVHVWSVFGTSKDARAEGFSGA